jgi:hypothetical protein
MSLEKHALGLGLTGEARFSDEDMHKVKARAALI